MKQSRKHARFWKRLAATMLTIVLLVGLLPTATYAAVGTLVRNSALENTALMQALQDAYGEDAQTYWALLRSYGLVDDAGNLITDEEIVVDGKSYTLDELETYLAQPGLDLSQVATVDGTAVTLENLKTVIEIERYLAYIQATYFTKQTLSDAQVESFYNLANAWANGEVQFLSADPLEGIGPAGIDHSVRLNVTAAASASENGSYTVSVAPTKAQTADITFSWRALTGSAAASGSGTATIPAGTTEAVQFTVQVGTVQGKTSGSGVFLVQIYDVKNALFYGGKDVWEQTVSVRGQKDYAYQFQGTDNLVSMPNEFFHNATDFWGDIQSKTGNPALRDETDIFVTRDETLQITLPSLDPAGTYVGELEIAAVFDRTNNNPDFKNKYPNKTFWEYYRNDSTDENLPPNQLASVRFTGNGTELVTDELPDEKYQAGTEQLQWNWTQDNWLDNQQILDLSNQTYTIELAFKEFYIELVFPYLRNYEFEYYYFRPDVPSCEATLTVRETTKQTTASLSAPAGTYYAGQSIPITASFAYPMALDDTMTLTVNGKKLIPEETGSTARCCTFLYPVDQTSGASLNLTDANLSGTGANGLPVSVSVEADSPIQVGGSAADITLNSLRRADAFAAYQMAVSIQPDTKQPVLIVTLPLAEAPASNWVLNEVGSDGVLHALQVQTSQTGAQKYPFQLDDLQNPTALTATVPLPYNTSTEDIQGQADFFLDGAVMMGKGLSYTVAGSIPVRSADIKPVFTVQNADGGITEYTPENAAPVLYAQQNNRMTLRFELEDKAYTWGDRTKISYYDADGQVVDPSAHFAWKSSDPSVAAVFVDSQGNASVTATGKSGSVNFTLVAFNDALSDSESNPIAVTFAVGQDPFLLIPDSGAEVTIREGQDAVIHWSSNLCQKNETAGPDGTLVPTTFHVRLYSSTGEASDAEPIWSADLTTDADHTTLSSATIPWDGVLQAIYEAGARSARVEVSAQYQGKTYGTYRENGAVAAEFVMVVI